MCLIFFTCLFSFKALAFEEKSISDDLSVTAGLKIENGIQFSGKNFETKNTPSQGSDAYPTSIMAHFPKYLSLFGILKSNKYGVINYKLDYYFNRYLDLSLYQKSTSIQKVLLRDLYFSTGILDENYHIWLGIRTFEFSPITLFGMPNPLNQVELQGIGIYSDKLQFSVSFNQGFVKTIGTSNKIVPISNNIQENLLTDNNNIKYFSVTENIISLFLSGKILLAEGRLFQPVFSFRYYMGGKSKEPQLVNQNIYRAKASSALILGGVFSRPILEGVAGETTVWFSSLPSDEPVSNDNLPINNLYGGMGRVRENTPMNTIGITDSSEFYFSQEFGVLTGIYLVNNVYQSNLPVLKVSGDGSALNPDEYKKSRENNKINIAIEPSVFASKNLILGSDINMNYVSEKLFMTDTNFLLFSPFLKWVFDNKLNSSKYAFTSITYGLYDWKINKLSDNSNTNELFSVQVGVKNEF
jgi:hypothetical protein